MQQNSQLQAYGPFHRIKSPTQSYEVVPLQLSSKEIWGKPIKGNGLFPKAKAYLNPLCYGLISGTKCADEEGIEFDTLVEPDKFTPGGTVYWSYSSGKNGIREIDDETVALTVNIYKVYYREMAQDVADAG